MKKWITGILVVIALGCFAFAGYSKLQGKENEKIYEELQQAEEPVTEVEETTLEAEPEEETEPEKEPVEIPVDFEELWEINPDIYAWIEIPGTEIAYPIVRHPDDDAYYLNHTIEGKEGYPGSIYTESWNSKDFSDGNTVIYGHNMKNGSMFAQLHKYEDSDFLKENVTVYIYTPTQILTYEIFAAVVYDDRHIMMSFDFSDPNGYEEYIGTLQDSRYISNTIVEDALPDFDTPMITLSTCISSMKENRWIVVAKLVDTAE